MDHVPGVPEIKIDSSRAGGYEKGLQGAKDLTMEDMVEIAQQLGANAIVGVEPDYERIGDPMLMVSVDGTAARLE